MSSNEKLDWAQAKLCVCWYVFVFKLPILLVFESQRRDPPAYFIRCTYRWPSQWGGEGEEGGREAPGGWDCTGVSAGLSRGGVRRQPPVPGPWSLPAEVWQLLFTLALQECLLQSLLHQISLDTDTGRARECVCSYLCDLCDGSLCVCAGMTETVIPDLLWTKPPEGEKKCFEERIGLKCMYYFVSSVTHVRACHRAIGRGACNPVVYSPHVRPALT